MGEIIELKTVRKGKQTEYTFQRFNNILMDKGLAELLSNTIVQHLKDTGNPDDLDKDRCNFINHPVKPLSLQDNVRGMKSK